MPDLLMVAASLPHVMVGGRPYGVILTVVGLQRILKIGAAPGRTPQDSIQSQTRVTS